MKQRAEGRGSHSYTSAGKELLSFDDFKDWWEKNSTKFAQLYKRWEESGFERGLTPSVDRKDNSIGYIADNIQWLTLSDNVRKFTH